MPDGLVIKIGADVNQAISGLGKLNKSVEEVEKQLADTLAAGDDFAKGLDDIVKEGNIAGGVINFLGKEIGDFKKAFSAATTTEDIQKFGAALVVLQDKQNQLIQSGLSAGHSIDQVGKHAGGGVVATQRLSSSLLGLNKIFEVLPPELQHATHGIEQLVQSFERVTHGTEGAGDKVAKFAGVLGEVGLGIAISVVVGLLVEFTKELFSSAEALGEATRAGEELAIGIKNVNKSIEDSKANLEFLQKLADINIDINFDNKFEQQSLKTRERLGDLGIGVHDLGIELEEAKKKNDEFFKSFLEGASSDAINAVNSFPGLITKVPDGALKDLSDLDKELIKNAQAAQAQVDKINNEIVENERETLLKRAELRKINSESEKEVTGKVNADLTERLNIIKEFTAKFASIKDPFPDFFTKNLPIGKVENKALRAALENAFKTFSTAAKDLFNTQKIDAGTIPIDIHLKPEIVGKSDLVRQIEDSFGDISKEVEDAVNKGIFDVPVDFKLASEGNGDALKTFEDDLNQLVSIIGNGDVRAIINISPRFDVKKINKSFLQDVTDEVQHFLNISPGIPLKFKIDAKGAVIPEADITAMTDDLSRQINEALLSIKVGALTGIGEAIGDALSGNDVTDAFKGFANVLADGMRTIGEALIKFGVQQKLALLALRNVNPVIAIAAGVALVALSQGLKNSLNRREKGGPVLQGHEYLVNEKGQEAFKDVHGNVSMIQGGMQVFRPKVSGSVIPATIAKSMATQMRLPKLANGGIVNTPTFALIGESGPEFVAPINQLSALIANSQSNGSQRTTSKLRGKDIYLSQARQGRSNGRIA